MYPFPGCFLGANVAVQCLFVRVLLGGVIAQKGAHRARTVRPRTPRDWSGIGGHWRILHSMCSTYWEETARGLMNNGPVGAYYTPSSSNLL